MRSTPLTIEAINDNTSISVWSEQSEYIAYSFNGGPIYDKEVSKSSSKITSVAVLNAGDRLSLYKSEKDVWSYYKGFATSGYLSASGGCIMTDGDCYVYGNVMSLQDAENFAEADSIYGSLEYLFAGNTHIKNHPAKKLVLPATKFRTYNDNGSYFEGYHCIAYAGMFMGCTGLTEAPDLPATRVGPKAYKDMFAGCTSLTKAPDIAATTLSTYNDYYKKEIPADSCFAGMFAGCTLLTEAPKLRAAELAPGCYKRMFAGCTSLTVAPQLLAPTLVERCYEEMFSGCSSLVSVTCTATELNGTTNWLANVGGGGRFYGAQGFLGWSSGPSGIPNGWTRRDYVVLTPDLAFSSDNATAIYGQPFTAPTLSNPHDLPVTYRSSDTFVATVDEETGEITLVNGGTTVITATFAGAEDSDYVLGTASYTLTYNVSLRKFDVNDDGQISTADVVSIYNAIINGAE